jgi:hypothetical protein
LLDSFVISHARSRRAFSVRLIGQTSNLDTALRVLKRLGDAARGDLC